MALLFDAVALPQHQKRPVRVAGAFQAFRLATSSGRYWPVWGVAKGKPGNKSGNKIAFFGLSHRAVRILSSRTKSKTGTRALSDKLSVNQFVRQPCPATNPDTLSASSGIHPFDGHPGGHPKFGGLGFYGQVAKGGAQGHNQSLPPLVDFRHWRASGDGSNLRHHPSKWNHPSNCQQVGNCRNPGSLASGARSTKLS